VQPTADPDSPTSATEAAKIAVAGGQVEPDGAAPAGGADLTGAGGPTDEANDIQPGMALPLPDDAAGAAARDRLTTNDIGVSSPTIAALGLMAEAVIFIAAVQGSAYPRPLLSTRVVMLSGLHAGGVVAGPAPDPRGGTPLQHLAMTAGAGIVTLEWQPAAAAIELEDAITPDQMDAALRAGWAEADRAADEGIELLVLAAAGAGAATAAAAVVAAVTGAEPPALLGRAVTPAGLYDDNAWMTRCLALRDALHRVRQRDCGPRTVLAALGGADLAAATGLILGAASRRTPVMIDGPVGAAAALVANDFSPQSRSWIILPDTGRHPAVRLAAEALQLRPWLDLCLDLGEGAASLAALPMLQTALTLSGAGEPVESTSLSRFDSTGNQVFVGVAKPVEPAESETSNLAQSTTAENATVDENQGGTAPAKPKSPAKTTSTKNTVKGPTRTATPAKAPVKTAKSTNKTAAGKFPASRVPTPKAAATKDVAKGAAVTDTATKDAVTKDPATNDGARQAPGKTGLGKTGPGDSVSGKTDPGKTGPGNSVSGKDAARAAADKPPAAPAPASGDVSKTTAITKIERPKADPDRPDPTKPGHTKVEPAKADASQADASQAGASQADASQAGTPEGGDAGTPGRNDKQDTAATQARDQTSIEPVEPVEVFAGAPAPRPRKRP
jgi:NaMN:DMB phosphoribosyltransferase